MDYGRQRNFVVFSSFFPILAAHFQLSGNAAFVYSLTAADVDNGSLTSKTRVHRR